MTPYLSVVVVGRNDDYGVNFLSRISAFIRSLDRQLTGHDGVVEMIVVEWNPLDDKPGFQEVLPMPTNMDLRIITVSKQIHETIGHPWPVLEMYGKNVGIRRAHGEYVLTTNPDIIFSNEMIAGLLQKSLVKECFYRCDRFDFRGDGMDDLDVADYVDFAVKNVFQGHLSDNQAHPIVPGTPLYQFPRSNHTKIHTNGAGDFLMASKDIFFKTTGLFESAEYFYHLDAISVIKLLHNNVNQATIMVPMCALHQDHQRGNRDPWDPQLAVDLARRPGSEDWGLAAHQLKEWTHR